MNTTPTAHTQREDRETERERERELEVENFILQGLLLMFSQKPVLQLVLEKEQKRDGGGGGGGGKNSKTLGL